MTQQAPPEVGELWYVQLPQEVELRLFRVQLLTLHVVAFFDEAEKRLRYYHRNHVGFVERTLLELPIPVANSKPRPPFPRNHERF